MGNLCTRNAFTDVQDYRNMSLKSACYARSKLPKKRRRVLPVEQPRRKRDASASNRRVNAVKHPAVMKELPPAGNKIGVNGMNMISLALQGPPSLLRPPGAAPQPLQARAPTVEVNTQSTAISLASLQPPLITAPPLQPRPATTGALDLMLPLQPKLLPGYSLQSSLLSNTLSTVRPPDLHDSKCAKKSPDYKPTVEVVVEAVDPVDNAKETKSGESPSNECNENCVYDTKLDREDVVENVLRADVGRADCQNLNSVNMYSENGNIGDDFNSNTITAGDSGTVSSTENSPNNN
ncbi:hypothetical protein EVAR_69991_1 [Eumeta japonica]|uniref:Uncharacterized protein n=1 Tax=Eumeta variegata TaxID=151549 RepID=A0A4C1ZDB1_EUMVA|nr:hypothetical protein EVAR_69991_1 [Eumeta japonica]